MLIQKFVYKIVTSNSLKEIALEEIKSIYMSFFKPNEKTLKIDFLENDIIILEAPFYVGYEIARRAALVKWSGVLLDKNLFFKDTVRYKKIKSIPLTYRVEYKNNQLDKILEDIKKVIGGAEDHLFINLKDPYYTFRVIRKENSLKLIIEVGRPREKISKINPFYRPFAPPATMDSITSRVLVNLSRVNVGDVFLDPFAGTGSLLLESYFIGAYPIGIDIHPKNAFGAKYNADYFGAEINIMIGDATSMPLSDNSIDAIATDPPYGRSASTFKRSIFSLYKEFLDESFRVLKPGRYLAMFYPTYLESIPDYASKIGFQEIFKRKARVHKDLSRVLAVFFKP